MIKKLNSLRNREDGFTLIELLIVVIIIGILAAIALPIFLNQQKAAKDASVVSDVRNTVDNVQTYLVANPTATTATASADTNFKKVQSTGDTVTVYIDGAGRYQVVGTNSNGAQYTGTYSAANKTGAYSYDSATGQFGLVTTAPTAF